LVFDDYSTDNSVEIIQQYLEKNDQFVIIQNEKILELELFGINVLNWLLANI